VFDGLSGAAAHASFFMLYSTLSSWACQGVGQNFFGNLTPAHEGMGEHGIAHAWACWNRGPLIRAWKHIQLGGALWTTRLDVGETGVPLHSPVSAVLVLSSIRVGEVVGIQNEREKNATAYGTRAVLPMLVALRRADFTAHCVKYVVALAGLDDQLSDKPWVGGRPLACDIERSHRVIR
jgi:hypothetical protein